MECVLSRVIFKQMPLLKDEARSFPVASFITLTREEKTVRENIRVSSNHISILDDEGQIIQEVVPLARILPTNLENDQVNQRSLVNSLDALLAGMNLTVLFVGSSFSGKEKLFDGDKRQLPLACHFVDKLLPALRQRFRRFELRMRAGLAVKEKLYDCNSDNKYTTLKVRESAWEGVEIVNMSTIPIESGEDFKRELQRAVKQKNRLVLEFKDLYASFLDLTLIRPGEQEHEGAVISTLTFLELPGVEILAQPQGSIKSKEGSLATRSLLNLAAVLHQLGTNPEAVPECDSLLGQLLKEKVGSNSHLVAYHTLRCEDIEGSRATIKFLALTENLQQHPIVNSANTFPLLRRLRAEALLRRPKGTDKETEEEKNFLENEMARVKTEDDYNRLLEKYAELKNKYGQALKSKSEAQLELIKCEEEKLEVGKALVQVQIENTKLLEKLQNKDYENGKKVLQTENKLAKKETNYQQCLDKISQLNSALSEALETRRDLQVQFVALKRNFIMQQKQNARLREDNQNLSLDVVNLSNQNQQLKRDFLSKTKPQDSSRLVLQMQNDKYDQLKRDNKRQEETITYLKAEVQRYKKELIERQLNFQQEGRKSGISTYGKDYDRIELENDNLELQNKVRLLQRRLEEMEEKVGFYEEQNTGLEEDNKRMRAKDVNDTNEYRKKLEQLSKGTNYQAIVRELRDNFARKDAQNLSRIDQAKKAEGDRRKQLASLKAYMRQMLSLLEEWGPKGVEIPLMRKLRTLDLTTDQPPDQLSQLRVKNVRLQEQVRRLKASGGQVKGSNAKSGLKQTEADIRESRIQQEYNYLRNSSGTPSQIGRLKEENLALAEENRRLTVLLKDGNKMDLNAIKRENDNLRRDLENLRNNQSSVSPSTSDQKLIYYQKHLKALEKERSELLSRCVVAEEQLKSIMAKIGKNKV